MATISSHVLDSLTGTHASGIRVQCFLRDYSGQPSLVFDLHADAQGRLSETITSGNANSEYELVFYSEEYFQENTVLNSGEQIMKVVVVRLSLKDDSSNHHVPIMLSPHSYSVWWSDPTHN